MLDYFNTRQQNTDKSSLIRKPYITYGISIQTPTEFQKPFTMISRDSFVNPYLSYEKNRKTRIPISKLTDINPTWTKKIDINQIQTQKTFLKQNNQLGLLNPQNRYYKELSTSKTRFRLTKGEFTNFLQRNHSKQLFGPLVGMERDRSKSMLTRTLIAKKSHYKLSQNLDKLNSYRSNLFESKQPFNQKHNLQKTRFAFRQSFKKELEERKSNKIGEYVLPQVNRSSSNMKYTLSFENENLENPESTLLSDKSIERLHDLRDFTYTQRYFTLDAKSKDSKKFHQNKNK